MVHTLLECLLLECLLEADVSFGGFQMPRHLQPPEKLGLWPEAL